MPVIKIKEADNTCFLHQQMDDTLYYPLLKDNYIFLTKVSQTQLLCISPSIFMIVGILICNRK